VTSWEYVGWLNYLFDEKKHIKNFDTWNLFEAFYRAEEAKYYGKYERMWSEFGSKRYAFISMCEIYAVLYGIEEMTKKIETIEKGEIENLAFRAIKVMMEWLGNYVKSEQHTLEEKCKGIMSAIRKYYTQEEDEEGDDVEIRHAALATNSWSDDVFLKKEIETFENGDFEVEFCSTEDTIGDEWVLESFNNLIRFVNESSDEEFVEQIGNYVNLESTIDSMLFTSAIFAPDNIAKNIIWLTYDGVHWFSSVYDLDSTWGLHWAGTEFYIHNHDNVNASSGNNLWRRIFALYEKEVVKRYFELRTSVLTIENISNNFEEFDSQISLIIKTAEIEKWQDIPSKETNNITQIIEYAKARLNFLDDVMLAYL